MLKIRLLIIKKNIDFSDVKESSIFEAIYCILNETDSKGLIYNVSINSDSVLNFVLMD